MTRAIRFHETGGPNVLRFEDVEAPPPALGQLRLRQTAVAVTFRDILIRRRCHRAWASKAPASSRRSARAFRDLQSATVSAVSPAPTARMPRPATFLPPAPSTCRPASTTRGPPR